MRVVVEYGHMIYIVENDSVVRDSLVWLCSSRHLRSQAFVACESFLNATHGGRDLRDEPVCLLLDVRLEGMSGVELFEYLIAQNLSPPVAVVFLSGHGNIPMAVGVLKKGALDFFEKPFSDNRLIDRLIEAEQWSTMQLAKLSLDAPDRTYDLDLTQLSVRERQIMKELLSGKRNKEIAGEMGLSVRTVESHRANVFRKLGVDSAIDLARKAPRARDIS
ncbi:MAG TPA: LuxR C-terminal-related transcriptional regulator [Casimicrobiaceae bacterium]